MGFVDGPRMSDENRKLLTMRDIGDMLLEVLKDFYQEDRYTFPLDVAKVESLYKFSHSFCIFRRISDTQAISSGINSIDVDIVDCWKTVELARGKKFQQACATALCPIGFLFGTLLALHWIYAKLVCLLDERLSCLSPNQETRSTKSSVTHAYYQVSKYE